MRHIQIRDGTLIMTKYVKRMKYRIKSEEYLKSGKQKETQR